MEAMASLNWTSSVERRHLLLRSQFYNSGFWKEPTMPQRRFTLPRMPINNLMLRCNKMFPWEAAPPFSTADDSGSIIKGRNVVEPIDAEDAPELPPFEHEQHLIDMRKEQPLQRQMLKWPMWLMGPSLLLGTGMVPTLWLPLPSVFLGANIASLLSLVGLDCIFNMGATLFFLMADACGRSKGSSNSFVGQVPLSYKLWNTVASVVGFVAPLAMLVASYKGSLQPQLQFISFAVLLGPYLLLLCVQMLTEALTWHWKSPVWLVAPVVYEVYRVLQLMRALRLGAEIGAPAWAVESIRVLVSWWVLVLGIQLMRVTWFAGFAARNQDQE